MNSLINKLKHADYGYIIATVISAWLLTATVFALLSGKSPASTEYAASVHTAFFICTTVILGVAAGYLLRSRKIVIFTTLIFSVFIYGTVSSYRSGNVWAALMFSALTVATFALVHRRLGNISGLFKASNKVMFITIICFALCMVFLLCLLTLFRYLSYSTPCYDFGIFAQMFDNMKDSFIPFTTCERGQYMSHFTVHISPVLYLLLPFYFLFPVPQTLIIMQIIILISGVIPLYMLAHHLAFSNTKKLFFCILYLIFPALIGGCFYDFHENVFLAPLILWTMLFIEKGKTLPTFIFSVLILSVKEDAAVYVAFLALYLFLAKKKYLTGTVLFALSVGWFLTASHILMKYGEGIMLGGRYFNVVGYDGSFLTLIKTAVVNPAIFIIESFNADKLLFLLLVLAPLGFLPLALSKPANLLLLCPMLLINLLSGYEYQYNIGYQYTFGTSALLFCLAMLNISSVSLSGVLKKTAAILALSSAILIGAARLSSQTLYISRYSDNTDDMKIIDSVIENTDRSASVSASTMFIAHLYDVDDLYHISYGTDTDIVIIDLRGYVNDGVNAEEYVNRFRRKGYTFKEYHEGVIAVMISPSYSEG